MALPVYAPPPTLDQIHNSETEKFAWESEINKLLSS